MEQATMSNITSDRTVVVERRAAGRREPSGRARALAERLERGARTLAAFAAALTPAEWETRIPGDGRKVGVVIHHVASVYPIEIELAQKAAVGVTIVGVTMADIHAMNAAHAREHDRVTPEQALDLLRRNSIAAAEAIRWLTDEELDRAVDVSLYDNAPVTCQFVLEDHAVRHSYHHFAAITRALASRSEEGTNS
jgi:DinB superfamily